MKEIVKRIEKIWDKKKKGGGRKKGTSAFLLAPTFYLLLGRRETSLWKDALMW